MTSFSFLARGRFLFIGKRRPMEFSSVRKKRSEVEPRLVRPLVNLSGGFFIVKKGVRMLNDLIKVFPQLFSGAGITIQLFALTLLGSIPLGIGLAFVLRSRFKIIKGILRLYIWLMRGTPLLLQLIFVFYGLPLIGLVFDRFDAALVAFILNYAAYFAEIFRGGIQSIPQGQYEAARVLRLTKQQTILRIVLPQVTKITLPSVGNEVINLVKDTSLVYILGLSDVMRMGKIAMEREASLIPLLGVALIYLAMTAIFTWLLNLAEKKLNYYR